MVQRDAVGLEKVRKSLIFKGKPGDFGLARVSLTLQAVSPDRILIRSSIMKKTILALSLAALSVPALAQGKKPEPEYTISGNFGLTSDYRFRGISQSNRKAAVQGGIDFAHKSGLYLGNWNSSISEWAAGESSGIEMDFYGGFKTELMGVALDFGAIHYNYPNGNAPNTANGSTSKNNFNTTEGYFGFGYGPVSLKTSYTTTSHYFGLGKSADTTLTTDAKGTMYYDLSFAKEIAPKLTVKLHYGLLDLKKPVGTLKEITDSSIGIAYDLDGWVLGLTAFNTSGTNAAAKAWFTSGDGRNTKLYSSGAAITLSKTF
jgi:uncharacterized protein (TIGR02001 family)